MKKIYLFLLAVCLVQTAAKAQCTVTVFSTNVDSLFTFTANPMGGAAPYTFTWTVYDSTTTSTMTGTGNPVTFVLTPGDYYMVTVTAMGGGCTASGSSIVQFMPPILPPSCYANFSVYPDSVLAGTYYGVNNSTGSSLAYYWNWGDGTFSTTAYPTHVYASAGYYNICLAISNSTGCMDSVCFNGFYVSRLGSAKAMHSISILNPSGANGIGTIENAKFDVYPNPATDVLTIKLPGSEISILKVMNYNGQTVMNTKTSSNQLSIEALPAGVYFIEITGKNKTYHSKFVKE